MFFVICSAIKNVVSMLDAVDEGFITFILLPTGGINVIKDFLQGQGILAWRFLYLNTIPGTQEAAMLLSGT